MRLLIDIDFASSNSLVNAVAARPWPPGTVTLVLVAIEYAAIPEHIWRDTAGKVDLVRAAMVAKAEDVIAYAIARLETVGIEAEAAIKVDDPRFAVVKTADQWRADLIVLWATSETEPELRLLSSVAEAVLRDAHCSVELVRPDSRSERHSAMKILLATNGSKSSRLAAQLVARRPWPPGSEGKILSVSEPTANNGSSILAYKAVEESKKLLGSSGVAVIGEVVTGDPRKKITEVANDWRADLVVMGSHDRRGLNRLFDRSVSDVVALNATCSVEVIRGDERIA
ncbi:MAG TPA: universal stress protein [Pyrinomonadaceae bacterium]|nr:universal stress protein [Pyrinomonadaceae bacterium]